MQQYFTSTYILEELVHDSLFEDNIRKISSSALLGLFPKRGVTISLNGGDLASTPVAKPEVHVERVVTLVNKSL